MSDSKNVRNGGGGMRQYVEYLDDQHFMQLQESTLLRERAAVSGGCTGRDLLRRIVL